jgi:hypothetical protein
MRSNRPRADGTVILPMTLKIAMRMAADLNKRWPHKGALYQPVQTAPGHYRVEMKLDEGYARVPPYDPVRCDESAGECIIKVGVPTKEEWVRTSIANKTAEEQKRILASFGFEP